jgi:hypothetical protein
VATKRVTKDEASYPLVMTSIAMENGVFMDDIDDLPINSMVIFHGYVSHNQMVRWLKNHLPLMVIFIGQRETDGFLHVAM